MIEKMINAIQLAESQSALVAAEPGVLTGFSGQKLVGCLQRLARLFAGDNDTCYLEVGVYQGLTLLSVAMACREMPCYGVDNFAFFDPEGKNLEIVRQRSARLGLDNAHVINKDYEDALGDLHSAVGRRKVAVYFVDGPHDYRSQLMCLELALPHLHPEAVIVVDDSNYRHVRQANRDFLITHPEFKLIFEAYTPCHPANMSPSQQQQARSTWWNGVHILVRDPRNLLPAMYPPTERSRSLYENEHIVHAADVAAFAPETLTLAQQIDDGNWFGVLKGIVRLRRGLGRSQGARRSLFKQMNTYSDHLPSVNFNVLSPTHSTKS
ncbi:class I SAM-dependent methyltransferase [Gloeobacter morelensis]|uniref:Class I SAM-dependent methyltransferase n=1 Tax=Gloeobacter morelensis MG652769 TaxID=2781736 RepID=A0ABY3PQJ2_9CYAN|nr:class I SAM-dependent methyltransferase [Gloeobacter morelensis]UFP95978.1 class I SAM-dependent methyltransferase [Gloeobacter morelensis MG652769]